MRHSSSSSDFAFFCLTLGTAGFSKTFRSAVADWDLSGLLLFSATTFFRGLSFLLLLVEDELRKLPKASSNLTGGCKVAGFEKANGVARPFLINSLRSFKLLADFTSCLSEKENSNLIYQQSNNDQKCFQKNPKWKIRNLKTIQQENFRRQLTP